MGQQQLLLLVLGIVIVGLAVVVGIQSFSENQVKANTDAMVNDAIRVASDAQAWVLKPTAFGGGNGSFENVSFARLGYETLAAANGDCAIGSYQNLNGCYTIDDSANGIQIVGYNETLDTQVVMTVTDTTPDAITTAVSTGVATAATATAP